LHCKVLLFRAVLKAKMCIEHWCNDNEGERPKYFVGKRKYLSGSLPTVLSHMDSPRLKHRPPVTNCWNTEINMEDPSYPVLPDV